MRRLARSLQALLLFAALACRSGSATPGPEPASSGVAQVTPAPSPAVGAVGTAPGRAANPVSLGTLAAHFVGPAPEQAAHVAVLLHGFGDRGDGLVDLARDLHALRPDLAAVALEARLPHPEGGRMWWPIDLERVRSARLRGEWPELERQRPAGSSEARDAVVEALSALAERGVPRERVVLAGFSQGAMLSVDVALVHPELVGATVAFSGAIFDRDAWEGRALLTPPVHFVVVHGRRDTVLPFAQGEALHSLLRRVDAEALWVPFDGPHTVSAEGRDALLSLLPAR